MPYARGACITSTYKKPESADDLLPAKGTRKEMKRWAIFAALCIASMGVHAQVYRCGNTYTQEPCKGGREVDVTPPVSDLSGPKTTVIYLCRAQGGSFYWIPQRCATRGWTLERSATVSKHVSWENQVAEANKQRNEAEELMRRPVPVYNATAQAQMPQQPAVKEQCVLLNERVAMLDSMGRAGSRYYDLDWVRSERKKARDEQFRLRC